MHLSIRIMSPRKNHFSDCFTNLFGQIGTQLSDHLEMEKDRTKNDIKGAKRGKLFYKLYYI